MSTTSRTALFGLFGFGVLLANWHVLGALVDLSSADASASHLILIPFVTLALILLRRDAIFSSIGSDWRAGVPVIVVGVGCLLAAFLYRQAGGHADLLAASVGGLVVLWLGGFLLCYGRKAFKAALFPLLFLGFMIPIPTVVLDSATHALTVGSSWVVASLFTLTGTPYYREGFIFELPNVAIEIAKECGGIRSTIALALDEPHRRPPVLE